MYLVQKTYFEELVLTCIFYCQTRASYSSFDKFSSMKIFGCFLTLEKLRNSYPLCSDVRLSSCFSTTTQPPHSRANFQKPAKVKVEKFVKLTDHTCACNNLTNFECEAQATGNGSYVNLQKLAWKNS